MRLLLSLTSLRSVTVGSERGKGVRLLGVSWYLLSSLWGRGKGEGLLVVLLSGFTSLPQTPFLLSLLPPSSS